MRALVVVIVLSSSSAQAAKYTLPQLVQKVRRDYAGVVAARESVGAADAQLSQARRAWWPQGMATFGFTLAPDLRCQDPDATAQQNADLTYRENHCITTNNNPTGNITSVGLGQYTNPVVRLNLQLMQPLYTSGKIEAAMKAAHAGVDVAKARVDAAQGDAVLNAVKAYWGLKWARASLATLSDGRDRVKAWVGKVEKSIDAGKTDYTDQDLLRLKIAVDQIELGLLDIQKAETVALAGLRTLTGDAAADIDDDELDVIEIVQHPLDYYEDAALTHRPEARMLDFGRVAVHAQRNLRISEMLPDFGLVGTLDYTYISNVDNPNNAFLNHPNSFGIGLYFGIRQPLDIPMKLARLDQAKAEERAFVAKRAEALGGIALEIDRAYADLEAARKRNDLTAHGEKVARGWYNSIDQLLEVGVGNSKDMVDAARSYFELRLQHLQAIMDLNVSLAALKRAAGVE